MPLPDLRYIAAFCQCPQQRFLSGKSASVKRNSVSGFLVAGDQRPGHEISSHGPYQHANVQATHPPTFIRRRPPTHSLAALRK